MDPVYILIRTSRRPEFFGKMMESIERQTYKNIVTIVHSDDPRDEYVRGDIVLRMPAFTREFGTGPYNLYMNRLLDAIPDNPGWYCFIDDDDMYASDNVIERLVKHAKRDHINVGRVTRWNGVIFPAKWKNQDSFQTEIFFLHTDHKKKARWWGNKHGDHYYSKQLTRVLPINWIDNLMICVAQEGKGNGRRLDAGNKIPKYKIDPKTKVATVGLVTDRSLHRRDWIIQGQFKLMPYEVAAKLEKEGKVLITHASEFNYPKPQPRMVYNL